MLDDDLPDPMKPRTVRRAIHMAPELGFCEIRTADLVWRTLQRLGWSLSEGPSRDDLAGYAGLPLTVDLDAACDEAHAAGVDRRSIERFSGGATGFFADLEGSKPGPSIALRIDMDGLPITESLDADHHPAAEGFASRSVGRMHACGHDGHIAIGLRVAAGLTAVRNFPGRVRLIFQPAEEGVRGAAPLVAAGICDDIDVLIAAHLGFGVPLGSVAPAIDLYATTKLRAVFTGQAAHASKAPEEGRNALLAAASATLSLHALTPFAATPTRVNVGSLVADGAPNIIPALATLHAEVRAAKTLAHQELERRALTVFSGAAMMHRVQVTTETTGRAASTHNDGPLVDQVRAAAQTCELDFLAPQSLGASDDASLMMNKVQEHGGSAAYFLIGSGDFGPHHSRSFDLDESALDKGAELIETAIR